MNKKDSLSVVISVFNGEKYIEDCLKSVSFASEIIVVNNSSTDKTVEVARKYTKNIFTKPNNTMLNINKNFGFSKATGRWILCLDADEEITSDLREEINGVIKNSSSDIDGYWIPRKNIIFGKWIKHTGWYPDHQMRLFKNGKGKFEEKHVHEMIKVNGKTAYLKNFMLHHSSESISQFMQKMNVYTSNEAEQLIKNGYKFNWRDSIRFPIK